MHKRGSMGFSLALSLLGMAAPALAQEGFGGARDNGLVRHQVNVGMVPRPETFSVEGMLGEHHFPVRPERCSGAFCVFTAMGHGLHRVDNTRQAYLLIEPISGVDPERHRRLPLNLSIVLDRSGSMNGRKFSSAIEAVHSIIDRLGPADRVSVVTFDQEARVEIEPTLASDRAALHSAVARIAIGGSTNIRAGLQLGYNLVRASAGRPGTLDRVFLLTDEQPNTGDTSPGGFMELVGHFAERHIGLSVVGVGLDLGAELARRTSEMEGGSYHYIADGEAARRLFGEDFDSLVTPVATRLAVTVTPGEGLRVAEVLGVPGDDVTFAQNGSVTLRASTVFLDRRRSGVVVRLAPTTSEEAVLHARATVQWSCMRPGSEEGLGGTELVSHDSQDPQALIDFERPDHYRAYALINAARGLNAALATWHQGDRRGGLNALRSVRTALEQDVTILRDRELQRERDTLDRLLVTMRDELTAERHSWEAMRSSPQVE